MKQQLEQYVHIIPLGFEFDRAVKPFERFKANRVYLLTIVDNGMYRLPEEQELTKTQRKFENRVKEALQKINIEVVIHHIDIFNILDVMKAISSIILSEKGIGNIVYVNLSAGSKLASVGAALAAMAHGAKLYYVRANKYAETPKEKDIHGIGICTQLEIFVLENFHLILPDDTGMKILLKINSRPEGISLEEILTFVCSSKIPGFDPAYCMVKSKDRRSLQRNYLMKLNKSILEKLKRFDLITRKKQGRNIIISITDSGKYVASLGGE
jgi:hypothetical protein